MAVYAGEIDSTAETDDTAATTRSWVVAAVCGVVFAAVYLLYVVAEYRRLGYSAWDLGIFTQAVKAYGHLHAPMVPLEGDNVNLMGDHFQPWIAAIGPVYRVFPSPMTLLVVQALLFAVSAVPIARLGVDRFGAPAGILVALSYGLSWGLARALSFDFHEIALAVPLIAFSLVAWCEQRWRACLLYAAPLVFCKEDLGVTVAVIAALVAWRAGRQMYVPAALTAVWGVGWTILATKVIVPAIGAGNYSYEAKFPTSLHDAAHSFLVGLADGDQRGSTAFLLLVITVFLALRSPVALVAVPTLAWRFLSVNFLYWSPGYHYSATLMPIMFVAMIDALSTMRQRGLSSRKLMGLCAIALIVAVGLALGGPLRSLLRPQFYAASSQYEAFSRIRSQIPDGASVAATNDLGALLVPDHTVTLYPKRSGGNARRDTSTPAWIIANTETAERFPTNAGGVRRAISDSTAHDGYVLMAQDDGIVLLTRR
ncbi:DUF2079 domain-containing protein [Gordonia jinhuaensis]|uniref:DUF2079 domain-containing protein n=1 Tax=Gordonia jinhuaensis TaxID=1517702 RepID=A0A916WWQ5_9ACTN|nr:DUF2079 domain-containing protein [Gordonia jinhuaensis]GGB36565.1 hypothetical protein GCM10011489_25590 [Gordonia jinhuaensis]